MSGKVGMKWRSGAGGPDLQAKKDQMIDYMAAGHTLAELRRRFEFSEGTLVRMRGQDEIFDKQIKEITRLKGHIGKSNLPKGGKFDPDRKTPAKGSFADWRMKYLGRPTTVLGGAIADSMLDFTNRIVFIMAPPGGGKDTTVGDMLMFLKCDDRAYLRCAWIMENDNFSVRRIAERIEPYLTDPKVYRVKPIHTPGAQVPESTLVDDYGPFKWNPGMEYPDGTPVAKTTWTQHELRFLQSSAAPESEPDLWATGVGGALYGSRVGLMVFSDLFTRENQRSATERQTQLEWCKGTADSRLDTMGRLVDLGTRVGELDNHGQLMAHYIGEALPYETIQEGPITKTVYTNGVCVVICVAIWTDEEGEERSYDEARFPIDGKWELMDGTRVERTAMTIDEARAAGAKPVLGLREIREKDPDWFECAYQQNPLAMTQLVDFSDAVLDRCNASWRSYGKVDPRELKIVCVDPARTGGAAWVLLAVDLEQQTICVSDFRFHTGLGVAGIKNKLIIAPITLWLPGWLSYEVNHEQGVLYDSETQKAISDLGVTVVPHQTHNNRFDAEIGVASITTEMRQGRLLFPTNSPSDKAKTIQVRQHFKNWDAQPHRMRSIKPRATAHPDDIAMAVWPGVLLARRLFKSYGSKNLREPKPVPKSVARRWQGRGEERKKTSKVAKASYREVDLEALVAGEHR